MPADRLRSRNDHRTRSEAHAGAGSRGHRARRCGSPRRADRHVHRPARHRSAGRSLHAHGRGLREGRRRQRPARAAHRGRIGGCALRPPRRHRQNTRRTAMTDKTREALKRARECITADRKSLYDSHINPATRRLDAYGQAGVDEYDDVLTLIDAALAAQPAQALAKPLRNDPLSALAIRLLVAAGHVSQAKADEAFSIACNAFEEEAQRMDVELPWVTRAAQPPAVEAEPVAPFWYAVVSKRTPVINKAIKREDVAIEYADAADFIERAHPTGDAKDAAWQPIEICPDNPSVLFFVHGRVEVGRMEHDALRMGGHRADHFWGGSWADDEHPPTHWRPLLPAAPIDTAISGEAKNG